MRKEETIAQLRRDPYISQHYEVLDMLGEGCFGKVLKVRPQGSKEAVALKIETHKKSKTRLALKNEIEMLGRVQGKSGVPTLYKSGLWRDGSFMELEMLSHDLNKKKTYTIPEITSMTLELLGVLAGVHEAGVLHQDIKPHNIMRGKGGKLYLVDFGLARLAASQGQGVSIRGFIGTPRYASIQAHQMMTQSKKDDLESLFYNLAYLYFQRLPWSNLKVSSDKRLDKIKQLKIKSKDTLFRDLPIAFQQAFDYIMHLSPGDEPSYSVIRGFFRQQRNSLLLTNSKTPAVDSSKRKRVSVDVANLNLLQVPDLMLKAGLLGDERSGSSSVQSSHRSSCQTLPSWMSDVLLSDMVMLESEGENCAEDELEDPPLPDLGKFKTPIGFKNPFREKQ